MNILYHHRTRLEDAQGIHVEAMVRAFRNLGHQVDVVSLVPSTPAPGASASRLSRLTRNAPPWLYEALSLGYNLYGYRALAQAIRRQRPDMMYERYALNTMCGILASRRFGVPLLLEVNAPLAREQEALGALVFKRLARGTERWICAHSTRTIAVSGVLRDLLIEAGVPAGRLVVMPNGIDPGEFHPGICGDAVRRRYSLDGKTVVGVVGWFRPWHGIGLLVQALHEHGAFGDTRTRVLLVGDGPACEPLRAYLSRHHLEHAVTITGAVPRHEVPAHIAALDIAVQPMATDYACPMKLIEYMGTGRCVVAPDQPNIRELVDDGATGFLFTPGSAASLGAALVTLLRHPERRATAGARAHATVAARAWYWEANARRAVELVAAADPSPQEGVYSHQ